MRITFDSALHCACRYAALVAVTVCFTAGVAGAAIMQVTISATGSGTIGGTPFSNAPFTITTQYDTATRFTIQSGPPAIYGVPNVLAAINIGGIGNATFTQPTRIFVNQATPAAAGFSR